MIDLSPLNAACLSSFGSAVIFTPSGGSPAEMTAIVGEPAESESSSPGNVARFWFQASAFAAPPEIGDVVEYSGVQFEVRRIDADAGDGVNVIGRAK